jgi:hypothetical protein
MQKIADLRKDNSDANYMRNVASTYQDASIGTVKDASKKAILELQ